VIREDLDHVEKVAGELHEDTAELIWNLAAELRAARKVIDALHAWEAMDGHFFGYTPAEGGDVGRALIAYEQAVSP
jgi:hypothetical protein